MQWSKSLTGEDLYYTYVPIHAYLQRGAKVATLGCDPEEWHLTSGVLGLNMVSMGTKVIEEAVREAGGILTRKASIMIADLQKLVQECPTATID